MYAFPRDARLTERAEFDYVFNAPDQRSSDRYFTVLGRLRVSEENSRVRLGMVVAKKRIARAHERNRVKRMIRESFRQSCFDVSAIDILVLPKSNVVETDAATLAHSLEKHWQRICRR